MFPNLHLKAYLNNVDVSTERNLGWEFDGKFFEKSVINAWAIEERVKHITQLVKNLRDQPEYEIAWLLRAVTCIDLTTLSGNDTSIWTLKLCHKARLPIRADLLRETGFQTDEILTAAVCIYPARVADAANIIKNMGEDCPLKIAAVATGFPSGQYGLTTRLAEIKQAVHNGAVEIDVVIDRSLALAGDWEEIYRELKLMKEACGDAEMKTILAVGELASLSDVYKASMTAMMAGSDFIKTSTGKEAVNATLPVGITMARAISDYYDKTGYKVGLKAAGGIRTCEDTLSWLILSKQELGGVWRKLNKDVFRIGASALLTTIEKRIFELVNGVQPMEYQLL